MRGSDIYNIKSALTPTLVYILGRCSQHHGGEPERAKGADGMQLFALDCIAYIVDAETDLVLACMNDM